jgi:hypothetical protein
MAAIAEIGAILITIQEKKIKIRIEEFRIYG